MANRLTGSVGLWSKGAKNAPNDVQTVQRLLTAAAKKLGDAKLDPKGIDGKIARPPRHSFTIDAIIAFQRRLMPAPDGIIDVNGRTWQSLAQLSESTSYSGVAFFPLSIVPRSGWTSPPRSFGANRSNGTRAHAGCDLYSPVGTWIHAVADGTVVNGPYPFYCHTYALEIDHGNFLVRYGEIQAAAQVKVGDKVTAGQRIAKIGHLIGITVPSDMLHFEMYDKSCSGPLTVSASISRKRADGTPFLRRRDLADPSSSLQRWQVNLPGVDSVTGVTV